MDEKREKIGITFSTFDLLHAGHVKMLEECKKVCDYLIVGLQVDPTVDRKFKNKPLQTIVERYIQLKGCRFVDEIIPYENETDILNILKTFDIDVRILGKEYEGLEFSGKDICKERNIDIYYNKREHNFSTTNLRKKIKNT